MDDKEPGKSRPPTVDDLVLLCRQLNTRGVKYLVVGGMAMINEGMPRTTMDIDLLIESCFFRPKTDPLFRLKIDPPLK